MKARRVSAPDGTVGRSAAGAGPRTVRTLAAAAALCALLLVGLTVALHAGDLTSPDRRLEADIHSTAPAGLHSLMTGLSFLGSGATVAVLTALVVLYCVWRRAPWAAAFMAACPAGASLLDTALKTLIHRHRPHLWPQAAVLGSYSFPSGHATTSAAFFAGLTFVLWRLHGRRIGLAVAALSALAVAGIGFSRIYLGVHWPSDVLAGFALGAGWVCLIAVIAEAVFPPLVPP